MNENHRKFSLLLVDDEISILAGIKRLLHKFDYDIHTASNGFEALTVLENIQVDAAIIDLNMPGMGGLTLLHKIRKSYPILNVIMLTGQGGVKEAVEAIKAGAVAFFEKPCHPEEMKTAVEQLKKIWALENENRGLKEKLDIQFGYDHLVGSSKLALRLKEMITRISPSDESVLIQGETGTGKELIARAIHHHSLRSGNAFVAVDCASLDESIMGSELFGHVKGAFTGALVDTKGLIRPADKGTLFLDEIGELSLSMQVKLLRMIQEKEVRPVGSNRKDNIDVRILAATNRNLKDEIEKGTFRDDLFFRLNVISLSAPPLRNRKEDIPILAEYFLNRYITESSKVRKLSKDAMTCLENYTWPGNVRELENAIRRIIAICRKPVISPNDLPHEVYKSLSHKNLKTNVIKSDTLAAYEEAAIINALKKCSGNRKKTAMLLGIGEATLYRKLKTFGL